MDHHTVTDFDIQALVDNELNWEQEKRVRSFIDADPKAKARFEMMRRQKGLLQDWWKSKKSN